MNNQIDNANQPIVTATENNPRKNKVQSIPVKVTTDGTVFPVIVGTESLQAITENKRRNYLIIQNNGGSNIYVNFKATATVNHIKIIPGGNYEPEAVPLGAVNLIADAAGTQVAIMEGTADNI